MNEDIRQIVTDIILENKTVPKDILDFINNQYNEKNRKIIYRKYHPDKHKKEDNTLYESYCKLIGSHKDTPCKSTGLE